MSNHGIPVDATPHGCPYLPGQTAVLPLRWYPDDLGPEDLDDLLAKADRRVGRHLYRPTCPTCDACKGIRLDTRTFQASRSQKRVWKKNQDLRVSVGPPRVDRVRLDLFNRHKLGRGLAKRPTTAREYAGWLVHSCCRTVETRYLLDGKLVGVGIVDMGRRAASSVYFYFDPDHDHRSLGTFSVLAEVDWARRLGMEHYYLGLYVNGCRQLEYKASYFPHERLVDGQWRRFEKS